LNDIKINPNLFFNSYSNLRKQNEIPENNRSPDSIDNYMD